MSDRQPVEPADGWLFGPPDAVEVGLVARGTASAAAGPDGLSALQQVLLPALFLALTGHAVDASALAPMGPDELAQVLRRRNGAYRTRIVQTMSLLALTLVPLPELVADRISAYADALDVDDESLRLARTWAEGSLGLAVIDFDRNGYREHWDVDAAESRLHTSTALDRAWELVVDDIELARRWQSLEDLPSGTLGRAVADFYRSRGFAYPGLPGSAPPYLAQHDWVHILADYGTTVESELEVFALVARATDDPRGFSLLAMVIGLFETGYVPTAAGLFQADPGHLSRVGMGTRLADAMRRGALLRPRGASGSGGDVRLLDEDWFDLADRPVALVRSEFGFPPKALEATAAGSVGPWQPGGISPFQLNAGRALARQEGRTYDSFGATVTA
jgi:hypothetical protein